MTECGIMKMPKGKVDEEVRSVKKLLEKYSGVLAAFALVVTTLVANSTCIYLMHQDEMPDAAKKLRKSWRKA